MIKNNKGFTLIELMMVIAILGIVFSVVGSVLNNSIIKYNRESTYYESKINARYAMNRVLNEIRRNYNTTYASGKVSLGATTLVNSNKNDATGNIYYYYEANKYDTGDGYGELRGAGGVVIAKYIKDFKIESVSAKLIKVTVKGQKQNSKRDLTITTYIRLY